ncbi:tail fiber assembly protein [Aeromonas veronii]
MGAYWDSGAVHVVSFREVIAMVYFDRTTCGFYLDDSDDRIAISVLERNALLNKESIGFKIASGADGRPIAIEPSEPSYLDVAVLGLTTRRAVADLQISIIQPAVEGGYAKPAHTQLLAEWQRYRYELTLVPEQPGWPEKPQWPAEPDKVI